MKVLIRKDDMRELSSHEDLDDLLMEIIKDLDPSEPIAISIEDIHSHGIILGFTPESGFVQVSKSDGNPPIWVSSGDEHNSGSVVFWLHGEHHTEIPSRYLVGIDQVLETIRNYITSGKLWDGIEWEMI